MRHRNGSLGILHVDEEHRRQRLGGVLLASAKPKLSNKPGKIPYLLSSSMEMQPLKMCLGERRKIIVPSGLAYGEVGGYGSESANKIKPNATLLTRLSYLTFSRKKNQLHIWLGGCKR